MTKAGGPKKGTPIKSPEEKVSPADSEKRRMDPLMPREKVSKPSAEVQKQLLLEMQEALAKKQKEREEEKAKAAAAADEPLDPESWLK